MILRHNYEFVFLVYIRTGICVGAEAESNFLSAG